MRVLLFADDPPAAERFIDALEVDGHEVVLERTLHAARRPVADVIVLAVESPAQACSELRAKGVRLPIVALGPAPDADACVALPVAPSALRAAVRRSAASPAAD